MNFAVRRLSGLLRSVPGSRTFRECTLALPKRQATKPNSLHSHIRRAYSTSRDDAGNQANEASGSALLNENVSEPVAEEECRASSHAAASTRGAAGQPLDPGL